MTLRALTTLSSRPYRWRKRKFGALRTCCGTSQTRLSAPKPVDPRGVAQTKLLLRDGDSPLYRPQLTGSLRPALQQAIDSLTMPPTQPCDDLIGVS